MVDDRKWKCSGDGGEKTMEMWRRQWMKDNGNVVVVVEERHWKCGGGNGNDGRIVTSNADCYINIMKYQVSFCVKT